MTTGSRDYGGVEPEVEVQRGAGSSGGSTGPALRRSKRLAGKARVPYCAKLLQLSVSEAAREQVEEFREFVSWIANSTNVSADQVGLLREVVSTRNQRVLERVRILEGRLHYSSAKRMKRLTAFLHTISKELYREAAKVWSHGPMARKPAAHEFHSRRRYFGMQADEAAELKWRYLNLAADSASD